jgi:hypothetical protein
MEALSRHPRATVDFRAAVDKNDPEIDCGHGAMRLALSFRGLPSRQPGTPILDSDLE